MKSKVIALSLICALALPAIARADETLPPLDPDAYPVATENDYGNYAAPADTEPTENPFRLDTEDPMFFEHAHDFTSKTDLGIGNKAFRAGETIAYGFTDSFALSANIAYQAGIADDYASGFSNIGVMAKYRATDGNILTDVFAGVNFAGDSMLPNYANTLYTAGVRVGRQWSWITLAGTLQSSWIFDDKNGMAYIDFVPEVYFRLPASWSIGANATLRAATDPDFNEQFVGAKVAKRYGHTMYSVNFNYGFEHSEWLAGFRLNILF